MLRIFLHVSQKAPNQTDSWKETLKLCKEYPRKIVCKRVLQTVEIQRFQNGGTVNGKKLRTSPSIRAYAV